MLQDALLRAEAAPGGREMGRAARVYWPRTALQRQRQAHKEQEAGDQRQQQDQDLVEAHVERSFVNAPRSR